jgi:LemA protein
LATNAYAGYPQNANLAIARKKRTTAKGYAKHEAGTLENVIAARNAAAALEGKDLKAVATAEMTLTSALQGLKINALTEAYPDLKANTGFLQLQSELSDTENKIASSRRFYNTTVKDLNISIQQFPGNLFAGMAGAATREFFEPEEDEKAQIQDAPKVKF